MGSETSRKPFIKHETAIAVLDIKQFALDNLPQEESLFGKLGRIARREKTPEWDKEARQTPLGIRRQRLLSVLESRMEYALLNNNDEVETTEEPNQLRFQIDGPDITHVVTATYEPNQRMTPMKFTVERYDNLGDEGVQAICASHEYTVLRNDSRTTKLISDGPNRDPDYIDDLIRAVQKQ